jgi:hypothetical protein
VAGIWNINSVNNVEARKILSKLSFTVGENFLARVVNVDKLTGEVLLKLLDGWQFSAKLQKPLDNLQEGLLRFEVEDFQDGKLQIKVLNDNNKQQKLENDTIDSQLKEKGINVSKDDYALLDKMVKHEIPLTKENISNMKTLVDFKNKITLNPDEENAFIAKYMESKNISADSTEGNKVRETLKGFFRELKNISEDDIVTLFENNIDLTEDNIKSFNNVFKGSNAIYKDIKDKISSAINEGSFKEVNDEGVSKNSVILKDKEPTDRESIINGKQNGVLDNTDKNKNSVVYKPIDVIGNEKELNEAGGLNKQTEIKDLSSNSDALKNAEKGKSDTLDKDLNAVNSNEKGKVILDKTVKKEHSIDEIAKNIKEQISVKTEEMKNIIKTVLEQRNETKPEAYNNLIQTLDKSINDFKVYNSVSNQYYYLDLPIKLDSHEYECKLMIKDERKKGKKIDSTDVKIAASVNTIHIGVVDAYIKVNNHNMDIDIKCDGDWMKLLDAGKEKILDDLSNTGYNVYIKVGEREKEMNITNCREFFGDNNLGVINTKV